MASEDLKTENEDNFIDEDLLDQPETSEEEKQWFREREKHYKKIAWEHHDKLKDQARAILGKVEGYGGVRSSEQWDEILEEAHDSIGSGAFMVHCLGARRYLDHRTVAILIIFRQGLIAEQPKVSTANMMLIDAAVMDYYNMTRIQGWIGNLCLNFESYAFGQLPPSGYVSEQTVNQLEEDLQRLSNSCLPLLDRSKRSMIRCLDHLK